MRIITNNVPRFTLDWHELTDAERAEFDWCGEDSTFVRYRGALLCVSDFIRTDDMPGWDGTHNITAFSSVVVRLCGDGDRVVMGSVVA